MPDFLHQLGNLATFSQAVQWVLIHGYWFMFIAMLIEGPIVTAAAAFAVALGYYNIGAIFLLSLAGDVVGDIVYYALGYWGRMTLVERFGHKFGLSKERLLRMEELLKNHAGKTILALKLTPVLPTPGLMLVGATKMPLKKFTMISIAISVPKSIIFIIVGYYFGYAYDSFGKYSSYGGLVLVIIIAIIVGISILFKKTMAKLAKKIAKI